MTQPPPMPGFVTHLRLLWGLRLDIALNRSGGKHRWFAVVAFLASSSPTWALAVGFAALMHHPVIAQSQTWPAFVLGLLGFVTACVWGTWPVMSAGVDDHSELSRYAAFPIASGRLMLASTIASLFEPRAVVFFGPLVGATIGYAQVHPLAFGPLVPLIFIVNACFCAALSRIGLHLVLNVLRQQRSAELIGGAFVAFLALASLIPPIDTSWLTAIGTDVQAVPDTLITDAALALGRVPSGFYGHAVLALAHGRLDLALADLFALVELTLISLVVAWGLLLQFHRHSSRGGPGQGAKARESNPFARSTSRFGTLLVREALDLWHNPRARLLASVPFVLTILLKLLSARPLFAHVLGASVDAWLLGTLSLYGAVVIASTFSQNTFGYDGHGMTVFLTAPIPLGEVLVAKNVVHAVAGIGLALVELVFFRVYFGHGSMPDVLCALLGVLTLVPVLLAAGNLLSLFFPVKFHANLKRRDKLPFAASMLGVAAASVGSAPWVWTLRLGGRDAPGWSSVGMLACAALLSLALWRASLRVSVPLLERRRELVLRAVTRE